MIEVNFLPENKKIRLAHNSILSQAITKANISFDFPCGGQGRCGKCKVKILTNVPDPTHADRSTLSDEEIREGYRLACQTRVSNSITVEIPYRENATQTAQILTTTAESTSAPSPQHGIIQSYEFELPIPTLEDDRPDIKRLCDRLGTISIPLSVLQELPQKLREQNFKGTAILFGKELLNILPKETTYSCLGVAFDIGTTTIVGELVDLISLKSLATSSRINPQTRFGDDVISRIQKTRESHTNLKVLHDCLIEEMNEMIQEVCNETKTHPEQIYVVTCAGNTTMLQLFAGISPAPLGEIPFTPAIKSSMTFPANEINLCAHPEARVITLPIIGGFVGGDTVAGILTTQLLGEEGPVLLIDIGTNGEIVLKHQNTLCATSCAAGPAFEGATISIGMRAATGAIEEIALNKDITLKIIGNTKPIGICGSALIDITAELLRFGILSPDGSLLTPNQLDQSIPEKIRSKVKSTHDGPQFELVDAENSGTGRPLALTHRDFRAIQLATAAIRAGTELLLMQHQLTPSDVKRLYVAGAFGNFIRLKNAQRIGLLPHAIDPKNIVFIGNSSLAGARTLLFSREAQKLADNIAEKTLHIELSRDPQFMNTYIESMFFPSADLD